MGYWRTADLGIYHLETGEVQATFPFRELQSLTFDDTGSKILLKSKSKTWLLDIRKKKASQVKGVEAIDRLVHIDNGNEVAVASRAKGELLRISLRTSRVHAIPLPINATFFDLKRHPCRQTLIAIDRKKCVHSIDMSSWKLIWSVSLKKEIGKDHTGVGQFSGDGNLMGAAVCARDHNYTLVLDAETGRITRRIDRHCCYGLPWRGSIVRDDSTRPDTFVAGALDLATGGELEVCLKS